MTPITFWYIVQPRETSALSPCEILGASWGCTHKSLSLLSPASPLAHLTENVRVLLSPLLSQDNGCGLGWVRQRTCRNVFVFNLSLAFFLPPFFFSCYGTTRQPPPVVAFVKSEAGLWSAQPPLYPPAVAWGQEACEPTSCALTYLGCCHVRACLVSKWNF